VPPIAAQPVFSPEDNGFDRREADERAGELGGRESWILLPDSLGLIVLLAKEVSAASRISTEKRACF